MSRVLVDDLRDQFSRTFRMVYEELARFEPEEWASGLPAMQVPARVTMHLLDCLDYYFADVAQGEYPWGHRYGGGWWELNDEQLPSKADVIAYAEELEAKAMAVLGALEDADLAHVWDRDESADTVLGHYVYALRHTVHHQGELAALACYHGHEGGSWA